MTMLKHILLHLDDSDASANCMAVAFDLAQKHDAHLTGIYVLPDMTVPGYGEMPVPGDLIQRLEKQDLAIADQVKTGFEAAAGKAGQVAEWCCMKGYAPEQIALQARYADLVIVAKSTAENYFSDRRTLPERLVFTSARPLLLIPDRDSDHSFGKHVVIAWNGRREAVRAVNDALPLLAQATRVNVLAVNSSEAESAIVTADLCQYLSRHGVNAEGTEIIAKDADIGAVLLAQADELGAGLIVMGAYGHSRWRELILGGATQYILEQTTIPVLLSH